MALNFWLLKHSVIYVSFGPIGSYEVLGAVRLGIKNPDRIIVAIKFQLRNLSQA